MYVVLQNHIIKLYKLYSFSQKLFLSKVPYFPALRVFKTHSLQNI